MVINLCVEGSAKSSADMIQARKGLSQLFSKCGFKKLPHIVLKGSRNEAFDYFRTEVAKAEEGMCVILFVDSESPVGNIDDPWGHLRQRDGWQRPPNVTDDQALLMVTCMETWICADRAALKGHYKSLKENKLVPLHQLEQRLPKALRECLETATRDCKNRFEKGKPAFEVLGKVSPGALRQLPSFQRVERILKQKLGSN